MSKLIYTRVALNVTDDESDEIKKLKGDSDEPEVWGKGTILIEEIAGVIEHYPSVEEGPDPEQCNVTLKSGKTWGVDISYEDVKQILREFHDGVPNEASKPDVGHAVKVLTDALRDDKQLYYAYQANIAMAFKDHTRWHYKTGVPDEPLHTIANDAAKYFLDQLIKSTQ